MLPLHLKMGVTHFESAGKRWFGVDLLNKNVRLVSKACDQSLISLIQTLELLSLIQMIILK